MERHLPELRVNIHQNKNKFSVENEDKKLETKLVANFNDMAATLRYSSDKSNYLSINFQCMCVLGIPSPEKVQNEVRRRRIYDFVEVENCFVFSLLRSVTKTSEWFLPQNVLKEIGGAIPFLLSP